MSTINTTKEINHSEQQAIAQLNSIKEMIKALRKAEKIGKAKYDGDTYDADGIRERIQEDPLCVEVRSDWHTPGDKDGEQENSEYNILLCTGGPACRIIGKLDGYCQPETARIEHQDWGTPWTVYPISGEDEDIVLEYASQFYFGE